MRRRFENNAKLYEYKIVSDCIGGGIYVDYELIGTVPDSGEFIYQSPKKRLDTVYIRGGVPMEDRQEIDSQVDTIKELLEQDSVVLAIALTTPYYLTFTILIESPILYSPWYPTNFISLLL